MQTSPELMPVLSSRAMFAVTAIHSPLRNCSAANGRDCGIGILDPLPLTLPGMIALNTGTVTPRVGAATVSNSFTKRGLPLTFPKEPTHNIQDCPVTWVRFVPVLETIVQGTIPLIATMYQLVGEPFLPPRPPVRCFASGFSLASLVFGL